MTGIGYGAFWGKDDITDITIPATVTEINPSAFDEGTIGTYTFKGNAPDGFNAINPMNQVFTINYPKAASGWDGFTIVGGYHKPVLVAY